MLRAIHLRSAPQMASYVTAMLRRAAFVAVVATALQPARAQQDPAQAPSAVQPKPQQGASADSAAQPEQNAASQPQHAAVPGGILLSGAQSPVSKRKRRQAESAYLAGAKQLEHDNLDAAEKNFMRAQQLDPNNLNYAIAISVARQHRLTALVRQVSQARLAGDEQKAQALLTQARALDPDNPLVLEHAEPAMSMRSAAPTPAAAQAATSGPPDAAAAELAARARLLAIAQTSTPWRIQPDLAGPVHLTPSAATQSFDLGGDSTEVIRRALSAYGIRAAFDDSVVHKNLRFRLENVSYQQAIAALSIMADVFLVPVDETTVLVARDDAGERQRLERQLEETMYLPGATAEQINEMVQVLKSIFNIKQINPQLALGAIVVRAPETVLAPMNRTLEGLMDASGEVVVEVRLYEVDTSKMLNAGANVPNQLGVYNVDQAAAQLVSQNSALVQQAIAQGLISATASNFEIAAALIGSGLVKSSLLNSTIGIFGGGITQTGITETGSIAINLGLNSSDTRALDDVQLRVGDREPAKFREGTRFPVTTSTYTTGGISGAASALGNLGNASINGVSLASLLSQFTGSGSATIPQVSYEDLGVTLEATPTILKSGRINMLLRLKIEALSGSSVNGIPVLQSREFDSNLTVAEGQSAMMASHVSNSEVAAMTGAPGLSELPGFQLPENVNTNKQTMQLVVVVTPHVVRRRSDILAGPRMLVPADLASQ